MTDDEGITRDIIAELREEIDRIDEDIIELVRRRTEVSAQIARLKRKNKIPLVDGKRERDIFSRYSIALGNLGKTMAGALLSRSKHVEPPKSADTE